MKTNRINSTFVAAIAILAMLSTALAQSSNSSFGSVSALEITNGLALFRFTMIGVGGQTFQQCTEIGKATSNSVVRADMHGLWSILAAPTNKYCLGSPIPCSVFVCNTATNSVFISYLLPHVDTPGFGVFRVSMRGVEEPLKSRKLEIPRRGHGTGGLFRPGSNRLFEFDLAGLFEFTKPGEYSVTFRGKLPSVLKPDTQVEFETLPLVLTIEEPKPGTNAPPTVPKI